MSKYKLFLICSITMFSCTRKHGNEEYKNKGNKPVISHYSNQDRVYRGKTIVKMERHGGIYKVPITVNSVSLNFIFDTGASNISISSAEAYVLYKNGDLLEEDILGDIQFVNATGKK